LLRTERVLIEINHVALKKAGSSSEEILDLLRRAGFSRFTPILQGGLRRLHHTEVTNTLATK
jgi:hypothetical protein